ncbi:type II toxin-antitoxin system RnlB family antitoxin [Shouchella patagoniensis]|uniref:type II toxin-antitoxin system RnlB family antitoxin n=1 Tax=Shouchella patagoniensis TaxID=228576 RepID=UPI00111632C7|nr:type II toxin-antitoxin system RnlB family antitoxin [Shouchella patagoniensis]
MDTFNIINTDDGKNKYPYLVISTSYNNPLDDLKEIENDLGDFSGRLLFDLLASNGHAPNRFIEGKVVNGRFETSSFKIVNHIDLEIKKETFNYFMDNMQELENSVLNNAAKFLFKKGLKI